MWRLCLLLRRGCWLDEEERPATRQGYFSLVPSWHDPEVPAQDKPCCAASRDNPDYLGTTLMDEFEPKGHVLHNVPGYVWEWLVLELDPLQPLLAQRCANQGGGFVDSEGARMTTVSLPLPQRNSISRCNLRGRSPPWWALTTFIALVHPNGEERYEWRHYRY